MPRRGSELIKFLRNGLDDVKYKNLFWKERTNDMFCLNCVHKSSKDWRESDVQIFEDWYAIKSPNAPKSSISDKRQRLLAAMKKSQFLRVVPELSKGNKNLKVYQFSKASQVEGSDGGTASIETAVLSDIIAELGIPTDLPNDPISVDSFVAADLNPDSSFLFENLCNQELLLNAEETNNACVSDAILAGSNLENKENYATVETSDFAVDGQNGDTAVQNVPIIKFHYNIQLTKNSVCKVEDYYIVAVKVCE